MGRSIHNFFDLMAFIQSRLSVDKILFFFCCVAFFSWEQRNKVIHEHLIQNPCAVVLRAKNLHKDYQAVSSFSRG